jgi:hypothetical protein
VENEEFLAREFRRIDRREIGGELDIETRIFENRTDTPNASSAGW